MVYRIIKKYFTCSQKKKLKHSNENHTNCASAYCDPQQNPQATIFAAFGSFNLDYFVMVMSAHADHTCALNSQSQRKPRTYSPGSRCSGTVS